MRSAGSPKPQTRPSWRSCARSRATTPSSRSPSSSRTRQSSPSSTMPGRYQLTLSPGGQAGHPSGSSLGMAEHKAQSQRVLGVTCLSICKGFMFKGTLVSILTPITYSNQGGQVILSCVDSESFLLQLKLHRKGQLGWDGQSTHFSYTSNGRVPYHSLEFAIPSLCRPGKYVMIVSPSLLLFSFFLFLFHFLFLFPSPLPLSPPLPPPLLLSSSSSLTMMIIR